MGIYPTAVNQLEYDNIPWGRIASDIVTSWQHASWRLMTDMQTTLNFWHDENWFIQGVPKKSFPPLNWNNSDNIGPKSSV